MHSELVPSSLSCFLMCIVARAVNINSSLGLEVCVLTAFRVEHSRRPCFSISPEEEVWEEENKDRGFIELRNYTDCQGN